jgi:putative colanic acid biosynthesis acetyltransferase WcaF
LFRLEAISASMFRSKDWSWRSRLFLGDDLFPWNLEAGDESAISEHAFVYGLGRVTTGGRATISRRAHICAGTHDHAKPDFPLLCPPIMIALKAWVFAHALVGPGVTIGEGAILGARAVAMKNMNPWTIVVGNPARESKRREITQ